MNKVTSISESQDAVDRSSYTVESLLESLSIQANGKLFQKHSNLFVVEGTVLNLRPWNDLVYFDLKGADRKITARTDKLHCPEEGQNLVFEGVVILSSSKFFPGLEVQVIGKPVGTWSPIFKRNKNLEPLNTKGKKVLLRDCIHTLVNQNKSLLMLGSETGLGDARTRIKEEPFNIDYKSIVISSKEAIFSEMGKVKQMSSVGAVCLVRGGDDESMGIWDDVEVVNKLLELDIPFYVALGHSHRIVLADKYADQSFTTPTALGDEISSEAQQYNLTLSLHSRIKENLKIISEKDKKIAVLEYERPLKTPLNFKYVLYLLGTGLVLGIIISNYFR